MTDLLLVRPKIRIPNAQPNPPLGLGYIAGLLREHNYKVNILDCAIKMESYQEIYSQIKKMNPEIIGITALSPYYLEMRYLSRILKPLNIPIILGGVHVSSLPKFSLKECKADFVVIGEGEFTTLELLRNWNDLDARKSTKGIAYFENSQFIMNPPRPLISNLDDLPFPAWDLITPLKYPPIPHGQIMKRFPVAPILTTRGCPYACSYCASTQFWRRQFRCRSAENIVDEIEYLVNKFKIREIHIWDDNFTLLRKHVIAFCREVRRRKLDLTFACPNGIRIDSLNKEILTLMKKTGFYALTFAIESGSQMILNRAHKKLNLTVVPKIAKEAKHLGYIIPSFFILGLPGENYETARRTIQFAKNLPLDSASFFIASPLPGSQLFNEWIQENNIKVIKYERFYFYGVKDRLLFMDGSKKLQLPKDAYREFYFRPIQIVRALKLIILYLKRGIFNPSLMRRLAHQIISNLR
ncbi:MAG: B12-binding domain-containing radical SAM protein [Candidatus Helarchaeota archaeon]